MPSGWVVSADISSDGQWALSSSTDGTVQLWEVATGQRQFVLVIRQADPNDPRCKDYLTISISDLLVLRPTTSCIQ